ncbi:MAG: glycerophosphodiester phosphodiesterase family protein [Bacteroidota bacterium]
MKDAMKTEPRSVRLVRNNRCHEIFKLVTHKIKFNHTVRTCIFSLLLFFIQLNIYAQPSGLDNILNDFYHRPDRILVSSHRAAHIDYPENSLAAMREAIRLGVDIIETDVRETKDSVLIIMHDKDVNRTTTGKGLVADLTYAELQQFFLLQNGKPTQEKIPTFEDVLNIVKGKIMLDIDYKADGERAARNTYRLIEKTKTEKQVLFFLYDYKEAPAYRKMNTAIPIMARSYNKDDVAGILQFGFVPVIHVDDKFYSDSLMNAIRKNNIRVWMNALGKYDDMEKVKENSGFDSLLQMKQVNVIQTDRPAQLIKYLQLKKLHG